ncbi:MAG TPA: tripartite tricarboxylate transporter substrate binding protein [Reyranella sp.]|nr:tripartite tricarboxylate transporter substrate binding protein [Reyranella sp.]
MKPILRLLIVALLFALPAHAQTWPQKPVRVVVPFPPGGTNDVLCRIVGEKLSGMWGQPVLVENKPGAGGNVGAEIAYHAAGDGYTLLCSPPGPLSINHNLYKSLGYDWSKFPPVTVLALSPNIISARADFPAKSAQELIAYAKANPGKVTFATQGNGSTSHLTAQMFATMTGTQLLHVPYKGEAPALLDLAAGRVDLYFGNVSAALRFAKSGQLKILGVTSRARSPVSPQTPAAPEIGLPDLVASAWFAIAAPPGTPDPVVQKINSDTAAILKLADVRTRFLDQGAEPVGQSTAATATFIKEEEARWRQVIKSANVTLE